MKNYYYKLEYIVILQTLLAGSQRKGLKSLLFEGFSLPS